MKERAVAAGLLAFLTTASADEVKRYAFDKARIPIARAVEVPSDYVMVYPSGFTPLPANEKARQGSSEYWGNTKTQAESVFVQMRQGLQSLGLDLKDIVKMTVFLVGDPAQGGRMDFAGFMEA